MPHGNRKAREGKKKKAQKKNNTSSKRQQPPNQNAPQALPINSKDFPVWENHSEAARSRQKPFQNIYARYKRATQNVKEGIAALVPGEIYGGGANRDTVNAMMDAADYIAKNHSSVEKSLMDNLKMAIRWRMRASKWFEGQVDAGHSHFLVVLNYCWSRLGHLERTRMMPRNRKEQSSGDTDTTTALPPFENQFASLAVDDEDEEEDDDDESDLPTMSLASPRPDVDGSILALTVDELLGREDRLDAIMFLMALDEFMEQNATQFRKLKEAFQQCLRNQEPPLSIVEHMMETAVAANCSIQQVAALEQELGMQHEHLNTVYRVFAVLVLPEMTHELTRLVHQHSPKARQFREADAIAFLGDGLECGFRNPSDPHNHIKTLDAEFSHHWQLPADLLRTNMPLNAASIAQFARVQVMLHQEKAMSRQLMSLMASHQIDQAWLPRAAFIGGKERPIAHTIRLLQGLSNVISPGRGLTLKRGYFGPQWNETSKQAKQIALDMDELLMGDILPHLLAMCNKTLLSSDLPFENELLPLFVQLKGFVKKPERPVSWALAFSIHSILTAVFEVQGSHCVQTLGETAKAAFFHYMEQLKTCLERIGTVATSKYWGQNLMKLYHLQLLVRSPLESEQAATLHRAVWNPLCAGTFLNYLAYFGNLDGGLAMIDSFAQLRMVLHLYNAFIQQGAINPGGIELLDRLYAQFRNCKAVWEGPLPERGEFVKRWWIAYGTAVEEAKRRSDEAKEFGSDQFSTSRNNSDITRRMTPIKPEELATSYRRICLRDFSGVVDKYHNPRQKREGKGNAVYEFTVLVNDTLD